MQSQGVGERMQHPNFPVLASAGGSPACFRHCPPGKTGPCLLRNPRPNCSSHQLVPPQPR